MRASLAALAVLLALFVTQRPADAAPRQTGIVVLVIDRSGSMQGPKLEETKKAAKAAASALHPDDYIAVVAFDSEAQVFVKPTKASNKGQIDKDIDRVAAGGGTNIYPGLKEAFELTKPIKVDRKLVILLSDGEAPSDGIADLVKEMRKDKITISTVAVQGADEAMLKTISNDGGGRMYKVDDLKTLSQTYVKELREAKLALK